MQTYPCVSIYVRGNTVDAFPFMVEANNKDEAIGKATRITQKCVLDGCQQQHTKVGIPEVITPEEAEIRP